MLERERVRLVIWDLDETFWRGTLSEGGIQEYIQAHHDIVIELAKRGIISSICSKNNYDVIEKVLKDYGIWDYFILPSIDWTPKGPRLKSLIEDIQLRPETVLFIDDNASNRAEAAQHVPGLQIEDETFITKILTNELFKGKEDAELSRLKQYQLLQRRKADEKAAGVDNHDFLRASNIHVIIEPNVLQHLDRAVELINRTNQLNFTNRRLSEDHETAKAELIQFINRYFIQAGLIRVIDDYGDYGFCGLYTTYFLHHIEKITHFCFSCRTLGMGVERWLYQKLGRLPVQLVDEGELKYDLFPEEVIDWINQDTEGTLIFADEFNQDKSLVRNSQTLFPEIRLRGGCELDALGHYLKQETQNLVMQTNYPRDAFLIRKDSSHSMVLSLSALDQNVMKELEALDFVENDFSGKIFDSPPAGTLFILSAWGDLYLTHYLHRLYGFEAEVALRIGGLHDLTKVSPESLENYFENDEINKNYFSVTERKEQARRVIQHLRENYIFNDREKEENLRANWIKIFDSIPRDCFIVVLLPNLDRGVDTNMAMTYHTLVKEMARKFPHVMTIDVTQYIHPGDVRDAVDHFDRMVYYKIYKDIMHKVKQKMPKKGVNLLGDLVTV